MLALARKFPSSGRSGPTPQAGFPPLPEGAGEEAPPHLQLNGKTRQARRQSRRKTGPGHREKTPFRKVDMVGT